MQLLTVTFEHYPTILALLYLTIILLALIVIGFINQKSVLSGKLMGFMINKVQLQERIKELGDHIKKQDAEINTYLNNYEAAKEVITEFQMKYNGEVKEVCRLRTIIVEQGKQNECLVLENNNLKEQLKTLPKLEDIQVDDVKAVEADQGPQQSCDENKVEPKFPKPVKRKYVKKDPNA